MDYQTKEKFLNLIKQVNDELADDNMEVFVCCTLDGAKMMEGIVDWQEDLDKLDEVPFNCIIGYFKDTDIPAIVSKKLTVGMYDFNIYIRTMPKAEFYLSYKHLRFARGLLNEQASEEEAVKETDFRCPPIM